jgi:plasminogen activator inhibitor 1 RNA-binding protein
MREAKNKGGREGGRGEERRRKGDLDGYGGFNRDLNNNETPFNGSGFSR